jgi:YfiR/HmsC-like
VLLAFGLSSIFGVSAAAQASAPSREYQVKAAFLFNFAQFVDWPPAAFAEDSAPLAICVLGDDPFGSFLDDIVRGEQVNSRRLTVRRFRATEGMKGCQVLFVSRSESRNLEKTLALAKGMDALTVSDADDFAARGGMIQLKTESGKIRIKINVNAAKASSLVISSKLLRSAEIVASRND